jgi:hypothetical protein
MARAEDVAALEAMCPWLRPEFQADLAALGSSTAAAARQFAADVRVVARLAAQVPRCPLDESGATPWTSFRREVALARRVSDQAAAAEVRIALRLTSVLPHTMDLLEAGRITVHRARAFVTELEVHDDEIAGQIDADQADRVAQLAPWRIKDVVRRAAMKLDPDTAALRAASRTAARGVSFHADSDEQGSVCVSGPAVPLTRWYQTLDARARALRAAGDPRNLDALRFDLVVSTFPCTSHGLVDPAVEPAGATTTDAAPPTADSAATTAPPDVPGASGPAPGATAADSRPLVDPGTGAAAAEGWGSDAAAGRPSGVEPAAVDCRQSRPVQAMVVVPVETALGLSSEPAWLDGYGWIGAPTTRQLLVDAELRQICAQATTGALVGLADRDRRPPPTPDGVRTALLDMVLGDVTVSDIGWRTEPQHDPSDQLRAFVTLRDRTCDGPTQTRTSALRSELDHDVAHPDGPTAAWNLAARAARTHHLKHYGWTPVRTPTSTIWTSPAGQLVEVPTTTSRPPGVDPDTEGRPPVLPGATELAATDRYQTTAPTDQDLPPWLPAGEHCPTQWTRLDGDAAPF